MPTTHVEASVPRAPVTLAAVSLGVMIASWLVDVLDYQYSVGWLGRYVVLSDAAFVLGLSGLGLAMGVWRWGADRVRRVALRLAFSLMVFTVALVLGEVEARSIYREDLKVLANPAPARINALGFRGAEIGPKDPHRYRIVILGDSFTFGNFVDEADRYSNQLQDLLGPRFDVVNLGYPGNNLPDYLPELDLALTLKPDFLLLQLYENDFETPGMSRHRPVLYTLLPLDLDARIKQTSVLYRVIVDRWNVLQEATGLAEGYTEYMARLLRDPGSIDARESAGTLMAFIDRARKSGVPSGGVMFPALYGLPPQSTSYPFEYLNERVDRIYHDMQTPYLDLRPAFATIHDSRTLVVSHWDAHPNAKANHLAALAIENKFLPIWER